MDLNESSRSQSRSLSWTPQRESRFRVFLMREKGGDGGGGRKKEKTDCGPLGSDLGWKRGRELNGPVNPNGLDLTAGSISELSL